MFKGQAAIRRSTEAFAAVWRSTEAFKERMQYVAPQQMQYGAHTVWRSCSMALRRKQYGTRSMQYGARLKRSGGRRMCLVQFQTEAFRGQADAPGPVPD